MLKKWSRVMKSRGAYAWLRLAADIYRSNPSSTSLLLFITVSITLQRSLQIVILARFVDALTKGLVNHGLRTFWSSAGLWLALLVVTTAVRDLGDRGTPYIKASLQQDAEAYLTRQLLLRSGQASLADFETPQFSNQFTRASKSLSDNLYQVINLSDMMIHNFIIVLSTFFVLVYMNWVAATLVLLTVLPVWFLESRVANQHMDLYRSQTEEQRRADYYGDLLLKRPPAKEVRLTGLTSELLNRWRAITDALTGPRLRMARHRGASQFVSGLLSNAGLVAGLAILGKSVLEGNLSMGLFVAAVDATLLMQQRVVLMLNQGGQVYHEAGLLMDAWSFIDTTPAHNQIDDPHSIEPLPVVGCAITLENVSFTYLGTAHPIIDSINVRIRRGEMVALVGENGAGKTTLVKLLLGLYSPTSGRILLDDKDLLSEEGRHLSRRIAPVFQGFMRYALTAGENIGVGEIRALHAQARVQAAAAASGAAGDIEQLPLKYETFLGKEYEDGYDLSGGQWQKIAIARAYMREAPVLILDEPTAALDPIAEVEVFRHFRKLAEGRTALFVSHRLGAARFADRVLVMRNGRIIQDGHHDELITQEGEYATLFNAQAQWYR